MTVRRWSVAAAVLATTACAGGDVAPQVGDCLELGRTDPRAGLTGLMAVDCADPHDLEVFHVQPLGEDELAGDARATAVAEACYGATFEAYIGVPVDDADLEVLPLPPTTDEIERGIRDVRCTVRAPDGGRTTGSVRATAPA